MARPPEHSPPRADDPPLESGRIEATEARFGRSYIDMQYAFVQFFTEHLADLNETFDQDLSQMLVLAVLGQRRLEAAAQGIGLEPGNLPRLCMSASRVADVTRMPRQTVRRKLAALQARGWIANDPVHGWHIAGITGEAPVRQGLNSFEKRFLKRLARLHVRLTMVLERPDD